MKNFKKVSALCIALAMVMVLVGPIWAENPAKINLNTATVEELAQLKGIGQKYAERVVKYREENGSFKALEDILKVPGIGPKTLEANKDRIVVE
ncbi:MAG: ComEA family DNA-binding protein [Pseudomonadota bacterium]